MKICFGTYANPSLFSKLLMYFAGGKFTHCWLETEDQLNGESITIETGTNGGAHLSLDFLENSDRVKFECTFDFNDISVLYPYLNQRYGWIHDFGFILVKLLRLKNNPISGDLVCSGLVTEWIKNSPGASAFESLSVNNATPDNLYNLVALRPDLFKKL